MDTRRRSQYDFMNRLLTNLSMNDGLISWMNRTATARKSRSAFSPVVLLSGQGRGAVRSCWSNRHTGSAGLLQRCCCCYWRYFPILSPPFPVCLTSLDVWPRPSWRRCVSSSNQRLPGNSSFYYGTPSRLFLSTGLRQSLWTADESICGLGSRTIWWPWNVDYDTEWRIPDNMGENKPCLTADPEM